MSIVPDMKTKLEAADFSALGRFADNIAAGLKLLSRKPRRRGRQILSRGGAGLPLAAVLAASALILFVLCADVPGSAAAFVWSIDATAIRVARRLPNWIVIVFNELTDFGKSGWFLWPVGLALLAIAGIVATRTLSRMSRLVLASVAIRLEFLFAAIAVPGIFTNIVKRFIGRGRPFVGGDVDVYKPFDPSAAYASMPSGHATTALSVLIAFGALFPAWRPYLWAYAIVICVSRVVVTAHHPTDVLAGAVVGALGALLVRNAFATRNLAFGVAGDGTVTALAGPSWQRVKAVARRIAGS
ncbi:MAG TPA: phosphatase PAP2 family protein [Pseudorhodoplanes sp.]|nr:phosphatase PAP2 family protein [Pseudorhodoplanes sp.]